MNPPTISESSSRRDFLKTATKATAGLSVLSGITLPHVHAAGSDESKAALIGCGVRGTGPASTAMTWKQRLPPPVAMGDVPNDRTQTTSVSMI